MTTNTDNITDFVHTVTGTSHLRVETDYGDGFVRLRSEEAERRQAAHDIRSSEDIVIEMLRNARDAHAHQIFLATNREGDCRQLVFIDDGDGIPAAMHELIFEPRVTSKLDTAHIDKWGVHGRGMALYAVHTNADEACVKSSAPSLGSALSVKTNIASVHEKKDQSTFPRFIQADSQNISIRGPKNIVRTCVEFALEERERISVYVGSFSEIAATLYAFGLSVVSPRERIFNAYLDEVPVCKRLAYAADESDFAEIASGIGLEISPRTARRIMDGEIQPIDSLLERIQKEAFSTYEGTASHSAVPRTKAPKAKALKISDQDAAGFTEEIKRAFEDIAQRYYLNDDVQPRLSVGAHAIKVVIPVERLD